MSLFVRVARRRGFHALDNALTVASSAFGIEPLRATEAHIFVLRMGGVADGLEIVGVSRRTANVFRRTPTGGLKQQGKSLCGRVVEPLFELAHMVPAVAEVIEIVDRLRAVSRTIAAQRILVRYFDRKSFVSLSGLFPETRAVAQFG